MSILRHLLARVGLLEPARALRRRFPSGPERTYQAQLRALYRDLVPSNALVFDLGANVGDVAGPLLKLGARVVAVEPQAACIAALRVRCAPHPRLVTVTAAVGAQEGVARLYLYGHHGSSSLRSFWFREPQGSMEVPMVTLAGLIERYGVPHLLKVDVEGGEVEVFSTLTQPIPLVCFEYVDSGLERVAPCLEMIAQGRELEANLGLASPPRLALERWIPAGELAERLPQWVGEGRLPRWGDIWVRPSSQATTP